MGMGDEVIAIGHAKSAATIAGSPIVICDKDWRPRWDELWKGCDWIYNPTKRRPPADLVKIRNGPGCRPYLHSICPTMGSKFNHEYSVAKYRPQIVFEPGELNEAGWAHQFTVIEPNMHTSSCQNKRIPWRLWQDLVLNVDRDWLQIIWDRSQPVLAGVKTVRVQNKRQSAAVVAMSQGVVSYEGGMIHLAGARCRPAVVVCTGFTPIDVITYPDHVVIHPSNHNSCGLWRHCKECHEFAQSLTWTQLAAAVAKMDEAHKTYWDGMIGLES